MLSPNPVRLVTHAVLSVFSALAMSCVGADLPGGVGVTPGEIVSAGLKTMRVVGSGKCVEVVGASAANGAFTQQAECNGGKNQQWTFRDTGNGTWEVSSANSGKCLDVAGVSNLNGARVQQWTCHGGANQRWRITSRGGDQDQLQAVSSGKCLDVTGASTATGALLQQWTCAGTSNQTFVLGAIAPPGGGSGGVSGSGGAGTGGSGSGGAGTGGSGGSGGTSGGSGGSTGGPLTGPGHVTIQRSGNSFTLLRDGQPYFIKGIAGGARLDLAQRSGVNSLRTYSSGGALRTLDTVKARGMTLLLGISLDTNPAQYTNEAWKSGKRAEISSLLAQVKDHPALLMWALGNEINLGADTQAAWEFVGELAQMIHQQDPNHPVMTVIAGGNVTAMNHVAQWAPQIDLLGVNAYKGVPGVDAAVKSSRFTGPYAITEFGPTGHWETTNTSWDRPIEQTSSDKALSYQQRYEAIVSHRDRALGSYVFLWAQKQERTPTWYGMFLETMPALGLAAEACPTVDAMTFVWSGAWPSNRAPNLTALTIDGKRAEASVTLAAGQSAQGQVTVTDPEGDPMRMVWEILEDSDLQSGGSPNRPARVGAPITGTSPTITFTAPGAGLYRLYVYVLDGNGHAGTANIPFRVM